MRVRAREERSAGGASGMSVSEAAASGSDDAGAESATSAAASGNAAAAAEPKAHTGNIGESAIGAARGARTAGITCAWCGARTRDCVRARAAYDKSGSSANERAKRSEVGLRLQRARGARARGSGVVELNHCTER